MRQSLQAGTITLRIVFSQYVKLGYIFLFLFYAIL